MLRQKMLGGGGAPIELVGVATVTDDGGDWTIDISGIDIQAGDVCTVAVAGQAVDFDMTVPPLDVIDQAEINGDCESSVWSGELVGDETEISSVNGNLQNNSAVACMIFRGVTSLYTAWTNNGGTAGDPTSSVSNDVYAREALCIIWTQTASRGVESTTGYTGFTDAVSADYPAGQDAHVHGHYKIITEQEAGGLTDTYSPKQDWSTTTMTLQER